MINDYQKKGVPPATSWRMPPGKSHWIPWQSATHCPNAHNSADKTRAKHCRGGGNEAEIPSFAQCKVPLPNFVSIFLVLLPVSNTTHRHLSFKNQGHRHTQQKTWQNRRTSWQPAKFRRHQPSVIKKIIQMQGKMHIFTTMWLLAWKKYIHNRNAKYSKDGLIGVTPRSATVRFLCRFYQWSQASKMTSWLSRLKQTCNGSNTKHKCSNHTLIFDL